MREILNIHLGQCGNQMGQDFWQTICSEHGISPDGTYQGASDLQLQKINVYFKDNINSRYSPRALCVDLEPGTLDSVRASSLGNLLGPDSFISGQCSASNLWARGFYTDGVELIDNVMDSIRKEAEMCDRLHGFQLSHSLGGGTGSGLGSLIFDKLGELFPDKIIQSFSIIPSPKVSDVVIEPYNAAFSFEHLKELDSIIQTIDNEALYNICSRDLSVSYSPTYSDMNHLITGVMSGATASLRFPGQLNSNLRKIATNLIPYPRIRFLMQSYAPLSFKTTFRPTNPSTNGLLEQLFDPRNVMCAIDIRSGYNLAGSILFRGNISANEAEEKLVNLKQLSASSFMYWIPNSFHVSYCDVACSKIEKTASLILNSTAIRKLFERICDQFTTLHRRRAFVHWYTSEGMDYMEFIEAESNLNDAIAEYDGASQEVNDFEVDFIDDLDAHQEPLSI